VWRQNVEESFKKVLINQMESSYSRLSIYRSSSKYAKRKLDPLPAAAFQILLSLADGNLHGYAIMRQVEEQTGRRLRLGPGTLYGSIQALLEGKLIEEVYRSEEPEDRQERRRYLQVDRCRTQTGAI
jgi:hypothetical protein